MVSLGEGRFGTRSFARQANWQGRSGRTYGMIGESLDNFTLGDDSLYLIARGSHSLWVGSTAELVTDPVSRDRFRLAMTCADRIFRVTTPSGAGERLSTIWDLEGAEPVLEREAA